MIISLPSLNDVEVAPGTTVGALRAWSAERGEALPATLFCGDVAVMDAHPVGRWPLVHGALLSAQPGAHPSIPDGPYGIVIAGPDAGGIVPIGDAPLTLGRSVEATLTIADPSLSAIQVEVSGGSSVRVRDLHSTNGSMLVGKDTTTPLHRSREWNSSSVIHAGDSVVELRTPSAAPDAGPLVSKPRLTAMAGSLASGVMMALMTGRWWMIFIGLAYPMMVALPLLVARLRSSGPSLRWDAVPELACRDTFGARWWDEHGVGTICVVGAPDACAGFARALSLSRGSAPAESPVNDEPWLRWLAPSDPAQPWSIVVADSLSHAPSWSTVVAEIRQSETFVHHRGTRTTIPSVSVLPDTADTVARRAVGSNTAGQFQGSVRSEDLASHESTETSRTPGGARAMQVRMGLSSAGPWTLDLDQHGPHLIVAGTTGAGKSALLETLILGLADLHSPDDLTLALIDFKGGAGLRNCSSLPHVAGVLTDLDSHLASRALVGIAAEIEHRKRILAESGYSSVHQWEEHGGAPARLVIVVDEFQELTAHYRDFMPDLTRLAAQGRSLGLHLILSTQRPSGAVTPDIRANVTTTIALRVTSESESRDLIGTPDAAAISRTTPGRAFVCTGASLTEIQTALPGVTRSPAIQELGELTSYVGEPAALAARASAHWGDHPRPGALWLPPLPNSVGLADVETALCGAAGNGDPQDIALGIEDIPRAREQRVVRWDPRAGALVIAGPRRSGRTSALNAISVQATACGLTPVWLPRDAREAARTVALVARTPDVLVVIDDADVALAHLSACDRGEPLEALRTLLAGGLPMVAVTGTGTPHRLLSTAPSTIVMSGVDSNACAAWSVPRELQHLTALPGRARWGHGGDWAEIHLTTSSHGDASTLVTPLPATVPDDALGGEPTPGALVLGLAGDGAAALHLPGDVQCVLVGDPSPLRDALSGWVTEHRTSGDGVVTADTPFQVSPDARTAAMLVLMEPQSRDVLELTRTAPMGLIDPQPIPGRCVVIYRGEARCLQLRSAIMERMSTTFTNSAGTTITAASTGEAVTN